MSNLINGLKIIKNFISDNEEKELLDNMEKQEWNGTLLRKSQHYGYRYNYKTKDIGKDDYIGQLPEWLDKYIFKIFKKGYINQYPNQVTINRYLPGEGIASHIDVPRIFAEKLYSISIGSGCSMFFEAEKDYHMYYLPRKTFMLMEGDARYKYKHGIRRNHIDIVDEKEITRGIRYSITFRNVIFD